MSDADTLLREIAAWSVATGQTAGLLGTMVLNHPGFVPLLRKRGTLKPETAERFRVFMRRFASRDKLPYTLAGKLAADARAGVAWTPARHDQAMIRHGFPHLVGQPAAATGGATKPRISAEVIRAAKVDGRDLPAFVTALIGMGLDCWRDDRILHGQSVA